MNEMEKPRLFIRPAHQCEGTDSTLSDRRSNRVGSTFLIGALMGAPKAGITRLESEPARVRGKMRAYLEELGV